MFYFTEDNKLIVHPKLNDLEDLDKVVGDNRTYNLSLLAVETRDIISSMYIDCENNFQEGIKKYEDLKESIMKIRNEEILN